MVRDDWDERNDNYDDELFQIEDAELVAQTEKAILIKWDGEETWIPRSVIEGSDLEEKGDVGCVEVKTWFAKKQEWV